MQQKRGKQRQGGVNGPKKGVNPACLMAFGSLKMTNLQLRTSLSNRLFILG
jgi:hypothetical protein